MTFSTKGEGVLFLGFWQERMATLDFPAFVFACCSPVTCFKAANLVVILKSLLVKLQLMSSRVTEWDIKFYLRVCIDKLMK